MNLPLRNQFQPYIALAVCLGSAIFVLMAPASPASAQIAPGPPAVLTPDVPPHTWVESAATNELSIIKDDGKVPLRYRVHKIDSKGDVTREVIETRDGTVARLVERNGQKLTVEEDAAERERLKEILASPGDFVRHHRRDDSMRDDSIQLVSQMSQAMIYSYVPGQPQLPGASARQIVIDFEPDKNYRTAETIDNLLTGVKGRMWIDAQSHRMVRIEGLVLQPVNFGWGILGKINQGGTIVLEQTNVAGDRWIYSRLDTHLTLHVLVVKTVAMNDRMTASDFRPLSKPVSVQDAVHTLLAMPVPLR
jgi:hypothetical protein